MKMLYIYIYIYYSFNLIFQFGGHESLYIKEREQYFFKMILKSDKNIQKIDKSNA